MIKYNMKHKYPKDFAGNTGSRSQKNLHKNRFVKPNKYPWVNLHQDKASNTSVRTQTTDNHDDGGADVGFWESGPGETAFEGEIPQQLQDVLPEEYDVDLLQTILAAICCTMPDEEEDDAAELESDREDDDMSEAVDI